MSFLRTEKMAQEINSIFYDTCPGQLSWLEHQQGKIKARIQVPVHNIIFLFQF